MILNVQNNWGHGIETANSCLENNIQYGELFSGCNCKNKVGKNVMLI